MPSQPTPEPSTALGSFRLPRDEFDATYILLDELDSMPIRVNG